MFEMTREELERELAEKVADVQALHRSRDILWQRCVEVKDTSKSQMPFHEWAGAHALMNCFDVFINNAERLVDELKHLLDGTPPEAPRLRIVRNDEQGSPASS